MVDESTAKIDWEEFLPAEVEGAREALEDLSDRVRMLSERLSAEPINVREIRVIARGLAEDARAVEHAASSLWDAEREGR